MKQQLLAVDCGNTNIKWALFAGKTAGASPQILQSGLFATDKISDHLSVLVAKVMPAPASLGGTQKLKVIIANVAGKAVAGALNCAFSTHAASLHFIESEAEVCGMRSGYAQPHTLGADRFAALVGAQQQPQNQLVVMAGTALTIDALNQNGDFLGGIIAPGLRTMQNALHQGTAQLPQLPPLADDALICAFPTHTAAAIASGAMQACVGAVLMQALAHQRALHAHGQRLARIVIAGGAATVMLVHLEGALGTMFVNIQDGAAPSIVLLPNIVLEGLYYLAAARASVSTV